MLAHLLLFFFFSFVEGYLLLKEEFLGSLWTGSDGERLQLPLDGGSTGWNLELKPFHLLCILSGAAKGKPEGFPFK